jgi:putative tryptophan/tyrosine transport system substrate-binding protein
MGRPMLDVQRRQFITLLGGAMAAWPLAARAQQPAMPVIGFLSSLSLAPSAHLIAAFRRGIAETGFVEGQNLAIEYRWADGRLVQLADLAADLVRRRVSVIAAPGVGALAAKATTQTVPIVFGVSEDPVKLGLVASLARPGGNLTGINFFVAELVAKRLGLLRELVPAASRVAVLVNPANVQTASATLSEAEPAARALGLQIQVFTASSNREIDTAYAALARERPDALFVAPDALFVNRRVQLIALAARHALPATYAVREYVEAGGLMSYGTSVADMYRQIGVYTGRVLKGAKPADLPVMQATKFELVINLQTARLLEIEVPPTLLARADEVIE